MKCAQSCASHLLLILISQMNLMSSNASQCNGTPDAVVITENHVRIFIRDKVLETGPILHNGLPVFSTRSPLQVNAPFPNETFEMMAAIAMNGDKEAYFIRVPRGSTLLGCVSNARTCYLFNRSASHRPISLISAATAYPEDKSLTASFYVDDHGVEYQETPVPSPKEILVGPIKNGVGQNPSAIAFYRTEARSHEFVVFYDEIFTVQVIDFEERFKTNQPLVVSRSQDYQLSKTWLTCPPELCFDSRLDYAYKYGDNIVFGRGPFSWHTSLKTKKTIPGKYGHAVQDVLAINGNLLIIRYGDVVYNGVSDTFKKILHGAHSYDIDAAFEKSGEYILLSGRNAQVFKLRVSSPVYVLLDFIRNASLSQLLPGAPSGGFDAAANMDDQLIYLFSNNFYYKYYPSRGLSAPRLIQGDFLVCEDSYYKSSSASRKLNISSYQDLLAYRTQFVENSTMTLWTESDVSTNGRQSTMAPKVSLSMRKYLQLTVLFLLISLAIFIKLLMVAFKLFSTTIASASSLEDKESLAQASLHNSN
ncbi:hypothetical protein HDE_13200 [Halotydeus destructor]|nr:hypothetical protein HDE_13200 [Halotydeus destructor]